ncbi:unnamed protein product [Oikopleura dioica]|uniref:Uncharacterized protein n=1 Tax=Oikopleura dioica TaxID=34765 RepID=E4YTC0_OIKDI|nr:unnamed protein product [Oikopleura dioica]
MEDSLKLFRFSEILSYDRIYKKIKDESRKKRGIVKPVRTSWTPVALCISPEISGSVIARQDAISRERHAVARPHLLRGTSRQVQSKHLPKLAEIKPRVDSTNSGRISLLYCALL